MKKIGLFFFPLFIFAGCQQQGGDTSDTNGTAGEAAREAVEAPSRYLGANVKAKQQAEVTTALGSVRNAVRMFQATEGRFPRSLNELVEEDFLPALPSLPSGSSYSYNSQTGEVTVTGN